MSAVSHAAPGRLELVRALLNTWRLPHDTRRPEDRFDAFASARPRLSPREAGRLRRLRDDLRAIVTAGDDRAALLGAWLSEVPLGVAVERTSRGLAVRYRHRGGVVGDILRIVVEAVATGEWSRLKACPDCRWVFYDHTRNASKRWCGMYAGGQGGRACGTIAKVRRYRQKRKQEARRARRAR